MSFWKKGGMTMMIISMDTKIAIAQFGNLDDEDIIEMAQAASEKGIHWYYFDETADKDFELQQLCEYYDIVLTCSEKDYMEKIK